jgi:hypothetical protein
MEIIIDGWRAGGEDRIKAQSVPASELPALSEAQREVASKMGISLEDYARSAFAGRLNQERLLEKTRRFAEILDGKLRSKIKGARINRIRLVAIEHEYRIEILANEKTIPFRVSEELVDDYIEGGSADIGRLIERNLETVLAGQAA